MLPSADLLYLKNQYCFGCFKKVLLNGLFHSYSHEARHEFFGILSLKGIIHLVRSQNFPKKNRTCAY